MSLVEFIQSNIQILELSPFESAIALGIIWLVIYDFYHLLHNAVFSWFRK